MDLVQLWKSPTAKLPEYLNWQHVFVKIEILPTREENIGKYAIPRCMFGWFGFLTEDKKLSINYGQSFKLWVLMAEGDMTGLRTPVYNSVGSQFMFQSTGTVSIYG